MTFHDFTCLAAAFVVTCGAASGQVVEHKSKVTGPRGRSIERDVRVERRPDGSVDRTLDIKRTGAELHRETITPGRPQHPQAQFFGGGGGGGFRGGPVYVERDVIIERPAPVLPFLSFVFGSPAPPPVFVYPEPVFVAPPPITVYNPPVRYQQQQTVVVDPVVDAVERLRSHHDHSRREGAVTLGKLGDARAVPSLIDRLRHDGDKEVRQACTWALLQIGDPQAIPWLEQTAIHDKKKEVREGAQKALALFPREASTPDQPDDYDPSISTRDQPRAQTRPLPPVPQPPTNVPALPDQPEPALPGFPR